MKAEYIKYENVTPDGEIPGEPGVIVTKGGIFLSEPDGGCDLQQCNCSPGFWLAVSTPRTADGTVHLISVRFEDEEEMFQALTVK